MEGVWFLFFVKGCKNLPLFFLCIYSQDPPSVASVTTASVVLKGPLSLLSDHPPGGGGVLVSP